MDVKTAFLYGDIDEEIYMEQPEGYSDGNQVCRLKKSLYGLKQSPRCWYHRIHKFMREHGFTRAEADHAVYYTNELIIAIYVDDLLIVGKELNDVNHMKRLLTSIFEMSDLGEIDVCLGIQVTQDRKKRTLTITQSDYVKSVLKRFGMADCKPIATPIEPRAPTGSQELTYKLWYQQLIGSLMYLMLGTHPEMAFAVGYLG